MAAFQPKIYEWANVNYSVPASVVGKTCEDLEKAFGKVTRENFLEAARDEDSPTHSLFEWDDVKAAEKYRVDQSGRILSNLRITIVDENDEGICPVQLAHSGTDGLDGTALANPVLRDELENQLAVGVREEGPAFLHVLLFQKVRIS